MTRRTTALAAAVLLVGALGAACSDEEPAADPDRIVLEPPADGAGHTHAPGQGHGALVGDGVASSAGGYRMADVVLPDAAGPGAMSFRILDESGAPVTKYVEEQTKLLHLYVVRSDLSTFRHLHPALDADGTWQGRVDLGTGGPWRVIAEFEPEGSAQSVVLGSTVEVPGEASAKPVPRGEDATVADDGVVRIRLLDEGRISSDGRLQVVVTNLDDEPLTLGNYLGASAHLTGFLLPAQGSGSSAGFVHVHPYGAPEVTEDGTVLTFHTEFTKAGDYRMFVQVRVDGLLHQVPITVPVR